MGIMALGGKGSELGFLITDSMFSTAFYEVLR